MKNKTVCFFKKIGTSKNSRELVREEHSMPKNLARIFYKKRSLRKNVFIKRRLFYD